MFNCLINSRFTKHAFFVATGCSNGSGNSNGSGSSNGYYSSGFGQLSIERSLAIANEFKLHLPECLKKTSQPEEFTPDQEQTNNLNKAGF